MGLGFMIDGLSEEFDADLAWPPFVRPSDHEAPPRLDPATQADCLYLWDRGVIDHAPAYRFDLAGSVGKRLQDLGDSSTGRAAGKFYSSAIHPAGVLPWRRPLPAGGELVVAYVQQLFGEPGTVPILEAPLAHSEWRAHTQTFLLRSPQRKSLDTRHVAEIVLKRIPMPGDDVPLDAVLDFAHDPTTQRQIESLRLWMARMALQHRNADELAVELDSMLHDFRAHMDLADMRSTDSALRLVLAVPLEVAQELLHLRPKAALDALAGVRARKAERLEAELNAPGHEVAYLRSVERRFT